MKMVMTWTEGVRMVLPYLHTPSHGQWMQLKKWIINKHHIDFVHLIANQCSDIFVEYSFWNSHKQKCHCLFEASCIIMYKIASPEKGIWLLCWSIREIYSMSMSMVTDVKIPTFSEYFLFWNCSYSWIIWCRVTTKGELASDVRYVMELVFSEMLAS